MEVSGRVTVFLDTWRCATIISTYPDPVSLFFRIYYFCLYHYYFNLTMGKILFQTFHVSVSVETKDRNVFENQEWN